MGTSNLAELVVQMRKAGFTAAEMLEVISAETTAVKVSAAKVETKVKARVREVQVSQANRVKDMFFTQGQREECAAFQNMAWRGEWEASRDRVLARRAAALAGNRYAMSKGLPVPYVKVQ